MNTSQFSRCGTLGGSDHHKREVKNRNPTVSRIDVIDDLNDYKQRCRGDVIVIYLAVLISPYFVIITAMKALLSAH